MSISLITPRLGLGIIKREIEKQADIKIDSFSIVYHAKYENMKFIIKPIGSDELKKIGYEDEGGRLSHMISIMIKKQLDEDLKIDGFKISVKGKVISANVYYRNKLGENEYQEIVI